MWALMVMNQDFKKSPTSRVSNLLGKQKYITLLKTKFKSIQEFNTLINTNFSSWNALLENTEPLNLSNLEQMNITYYEMFCHKYFATVKATLKKHAPNKLYLFLQIK